MGVWSSEQFLTLFNDPADALYVRFDGQTSVKLWTQYGRANCSNQSLLLKGGFFSIGPLRSLLFFITMTIRTLYYHYKNIRYYCPNCWRNRRDRGFRLNTGRMVYSLVQMAATRHWTASLLANFVCLEQILCYLQKILLASFQCKTGIERFQYTARHLQCIHLPKEQDTCQSHLDRPLYPSLR